MDKQDIQHWNGEGLPPVGAVCECLIPNANGITGSYIWQECKVLYVFDATKECAVQHVKHGNLYYSDEFRPIRTPEQIEAERRERISEQMRTIHRESIGDTRNGFSAIYDAIRAGKIEGVKIDG